MIYEKSLLGLLRNRGRILLENKRAQVLEDLMKTVNYSYILVFLIIYLQRII
jgi:hypothetical protein